MFEGLILKQVSPMLLLSSGQLEVIMDRRMMQDDNRGLGQGLKDNKKTANRFRLLLERRSMGNKVSEMAVEVVIEGARALMKSSLHIWLCWTIIWELCARLLKVVCFFILCSLTLLFIFFSPSAHYHCICLFVILFHSNSVSILFFFRSITFSLMAFLANSPPCFIFSSPKSWLTEFKR